MHTFTHLFKKITPIDHAKKALDEAIDLLHITEIAREDAQAKAARCAQDIAMLQRRIKRLAKIVGMPMLTERIETTTVGDMTHTSVRRVR